MTNNQAVNLENAVNEELTCGLCLCCLEKAARRAMGKQPMPQIESVDDLLDYRFDIATLVATEMWDHIENEINDVLASCNLRPMFPHEVCRHVVDHYICEMIQQISDELGAFIYAAFYRQVRNYVEGNQRGGGKTVEDLMAERMARIGFEFNPSYLPKFYEFSAEASCVQ